MNCLINRDVLCLKIEEQILEVPKKDYIHNNTPNYTENIY